MPIENSVFPNGSLSAEWRKRAEEELNETSENIKHEIFALRVMVQSKCDNHLEHRYNWYFSVDDKNLIVPSDDAFLLRFLRARKFDSKKAFHMVIDNPETK